MGRTNPTFRDALSSVRGDWDRYRRGLRREHKDAFDALFADAEAHADASGHLNAREPMHPVFLSMLLEQKLTIRDLEARVADLEASLDDEATPDADASTADTAADAAADDARPDPEAD
ncbi:MAG: hypothetical protein V5A18_04935 [Haloarculaceae archaeon]